MKRKNYIFTNKRHSKRAIMSTILGLISSVSLGIVLYLTYLSGGNAPLSYGMTGLLAMIFSLTGISLGILTVQEQDNFKLFPVMGIILNMATLLILAFIVQLGM